MTEPRQYFALRHPVATLVVSLLLMLIAARSLVELKLDALPDVTPNQVIVLTTAPGLMPEEVERRVTRPVEVAIASTVGLKEMRSLSRYGVSSVVATFDDDFEVLKARQLISEALLAVDLPSGIDTPTLAPITGGLGEVYHFILRSKMRTPAELLELSELRVAPILKRVPGVVEVNTCGGNVRTLEVTLDSAAMANANLSFQQVQGLMENQLGERAGAALKRGAKQTLFRSSYLPKTPEELKSFVLTPNLTGESLAPVLTLGSVAEVSEGQLPRLGAATADGKGEILYVMIQMLRGANALDVVTAIESKMDAVRSALPKDVELEVAYNRKDIVSATLKTVGTNLLEGGLLVVLVLFFLLGSVRAGLLVALTIPASMLFAVAGMVFFDIPGNLMSLGAIDFGLLVDGAVVVTETLFHLQSKSKASDDAESPEIKRSLNAVMRQVGRPVVFGVLIIVLVYVPVLTLSGVDGKLFRPMASTVIMALLAALVLSVTFVPAALSLWLKPKHIPTRPPFLIRHAERAYRPLLNASMARPAAVLAISTIVVAVGIFMGTALGSAFVPTLDEGDLVIQTTRAPDISLESAVKRAQNLESVVLAHVPEVKQVVSRIGSPAVATDIMGLEQADIFVSLKPTDQWRDNLSKSQIVEEIDALLQRHDSGSDPEFTQPIQMRFNEIIGGETSDITVSIFGPDLKVSRALAEHIATILAKVEGADDVRVRSPPDVEFVEVTPKVRQAAQHGFLPNNIADLTEAIQKGYPLARTWVGPLEVPVTLRIARSPSPDELADIMVPTGAGRVAFEDIATITKSKTPSLISRHDGERRVIVGFNIRGRNLGDVAEEAQNSISKVDLPEGIRLEWGGQAQTLADAQARLMVIIPLLLLLIFGVLTFALSSVRPALIVFLHIPLASVGGLIALYLRGLPISISAAIGFIALSGIAVLNGVVLMNEILRQENEEEHSPQEAAKLAALHRMRPVLMTALVAALGFLPMALSTGIGAEVQRPLATVVLGGLTTSTLVTLFMLPSLYSFFVKSRKVTTRPL